MFHAYIHNHLPAAKQSDIGQANQRQPIVAETRQQRLQRFEKERQRRLLYAKVVSTSLFIIMALAAYLYWPNNERLDLLRSTKVPLSTVIAFLAFLTFLQNIHGYYYYSASVSRSCQKSVKIFLLVLVTALVFPVSADNSVDLDLTSSDDKFIYHYKGTAHVNPQVIHQRRSYVPCDLAIMVQMMQKTYEERQKLCDKGFSIDQGRPIFDNQYNKFLALNHTTSLLVAKQSCVVLNLHLPEVRSQRDIKELKSFMASVGIAQVYAGIYFDNRLHNPVFMSTLGLANGTIDNLKIVDDATNTETNWQTIDGAQRYSQYNQQTGIYFTYRTDSGLGLQLRVHYAGQIGLRPLCIKKVNSYDPRNTQDWKDACTSSQRHLRALIVDTKKVVENIFPRSIKNTPQSLPYMIDRYHNPISKRSTQSLYEEILTAKHGNDTICDRLKEDEQLKVGLFGENAVVRDEIYGNNVEVFDHHMVKRGAMAAVGMVLSIITSAAIYFAQYHEQVTQTIHSGFISAKSLSDLIKVNFQNIKTDDINQVLSTLDTTNKQFELVRDQRTYILHYTDKIRANFYHNRDAPSAYIFLSQKQYDETKTSIRDKYLVNPAESVKDLKIKTLVTNIAYEVFLTIPIEFEKTKSYIYQLIPFPVYEGNSSYLPILTHEFFAASAKTGGKFTPIAPNELEQCKSESFCELASPTYVAATAPCGISNYFEQDRDMCQYRQMAYSLSNFYYLIDEWAYFSIPPNRTEKLSLTCITDVKDLGPIPMEEQGAIRLPLGCSGHDTQGTSFAPVQRKFRDHIPGVDDTYKIITSKRKNVEKDDNNLLTSDQVVVIKNLLNHDYILYAILGIVALLLFALICCKQTVTNKLGHILQFLSSCKSSRIDTQDGQPFELEELMEGTSYATIVRSPKLPRNTAHDDSESIPIPVPAPRILLSSQVAVESETTNDSYIDRTKQACQSIINSDGVVAINEDLKFYMKKFKDSKGDYKYKCKICNSVHNSYGEVKTHIEANHE